MAFLTVIAPLVAVTYPIDKISDGHAQAFNTWLKEYIFNLLIQPMHLLLYVLLISMAFELAGQNMIYCLVAIGFMMPAEKFIRSLFGFDKAKTPGFLAGATGAALTVGLMQGLANFGKKVPHGDHAKMPLNGENKEDNNEIYNRSADSGKGFESLGIADETSLNDDNYSTNFRAVDNNNQRMDNTQTSPNNLVSNPNNQIMDANMQDDLIDNDNGLTPEEQEEYDTLNDEMLNVSNEDMYLNPDYYASKQARLDELQKKIDDKTNIQTPPPSKDGRKINTTNALNAGQINPRITLDEVAEVENAMNPKIQEPKSREERLEEFKNKHAAKSILNDPKI